MPVFNFELKHRQSTTPLGCAPFTTSSSGSRSDASQSQTCLALPRETAAGAVTHSANIMAVLLDMGMEVEPDTKGILSVASSLATALAGAG